MDSSTINSQRHPCRTWFFSSTICANLRYNSLTIPDSYLHKSWAAFQFVHVLQFLGLVWLLWPFHLSMCLLGGCHWAASLRFHEEQAVLHLNIGQKFVLLSSLCCEMLWYLEIGWQKHTHFIIHFFITMVSKDKKVQRRPVVTHMAIFH